MWFALAAGFALASAPAGAVTVGRLQALPIPAGASVVGNDGGHRLVFSTAGGDAFVLDVRSERSIAIALPGNNCSLLGTAAGLVANCDDPNLNAFVRSYGGTHWSPVTAPPSWTLGAGVMMIEPTGLGRRWIAFAVQDYHVNYDLYVSLSDGSTFDSPGPRLQSPTVVPDLDAAEGTRRICTPLSRLTQYVKPWGLEWNRIHGDNTLRLRRCSSRRATTLCAGEGCANTGLGDRAATWSKDDVGYRRLLKTGRTTKVRLAGRHVILTPFGNNVLVTSFPHNGTQPSYALLRN